MKIAVTFEEGEVYQHFGHTKTFKIYTVEAGSVTESQLVATDGSGHGALAGFLKEREVDAVICGGIGAGARTALDEAGIRLYPGASGSADEQVKALIAGELKYDPDTLCTHHGQNGKEGHKCGGKSHGEARSCGGHNCKS